MSSSAAADAVAASLPLPSPPLLSLPLPSRRLPPSPPPSPLSRNPWRARTGIPLRPKPKSQIDQLCSHFHLRCHASQTHESCLKEGREEGSWDNLAKKEEEGKFAENVSHEEEGRPRSSSAEFLKSSPPLLPLSLSLSLELSSFHCGAK